MLKMKPNYCHSKLFCRFFFHNLLLNFISATKANNTPKASKMPQTTTEPSWMFWKINNNETELLGICFCPSQAIFSRGNATNRTLHIILAMALSFAVDTLSHPSSISQQTENSIPFDDHVLSNERANERTGTSHRHFLLVSQMKFTVKQMIANEVDSIPLAVRRWLLLLLVPLVLQLMPTTRAWMLNTSIFLSSK